MYYDTFNIFPRSINLLDSLDSRYSILKPLPVKATSLWKRRITGPSYWMLAGATSPQYLVVSPFTVSDT